MDSWSNLEWHYEVHSRFGEQLVYYLLRIRPFQVLEIQTKLKELLQRKNLESVRVSVIFGRNDLLIRAWLHPVTTREFPEWLKNALQFDTEVLVFTVAKPFVISSVSADTTLPEELLDKLSDEGMIQAVEDGHDLDWLRELIDAGVVIQQEQTGADPIRFFLAIRLSQEDHRIRDAVSRELLEHINKEMPTIKNVSIYQGNGFCHLLLKGEVGTNYFAIGELVQWILQSLSTFEASTETYVVALANPLVETPDKISKATFHAIEGKDLLVEKILPELYGVHYHHKDQIERFFNSVSRQTVVDARRLVHDYLLGYLKGKNADVRGVLFTLFNELEEYLRNNHISFAVSNRVEVTEVYKAIHFNENAKQITLAPLLDLYYYIINVRNLSKNLKELGQLRELSNLRNKPFHGDWDVKTEWDKSLAQILNSWSGLSELIRLVRKSGGREYDFTYLPFLHDKP
jgi:hypothetical protein